MKIDSLVRPKGILLDVDGTLTNKQRVVSERTKEVLAKISKKGIKTGVATGRSYASLAGYILPLFPPEALHIVASGGQIVSSRGQVVWEKLIPHEKVVFLAKEIEKRGAYFIFGQKDILYASASVVPNLLKHPWGIKADSANTLKDWSTPLISVVSINDGVRNFLGSQKDLNAEEIATGYKPPYFDITAKGVNKGTAAKIWAEKQGILLKDTLAIGDSVNDIELMRVVGASAAMGHAIDEAKKAAQITIGTSEEDGLAEYLEKLLG